MKKIIVALAFFIAGGILALIWMRKVRKEIIQNVKCPPPEKCNCQNVEIEDEYPAPATSYSPYYGIGEIREGQQGVPVPPYFSTFHY